MRPPSNGSILGNIILVLAALIVLSTIVGVDVIGFLERASVSSLLTSTWGALAAAAETTLSALRFLYESVINIF